MEKKAIVYMPESCYKKMVEHIYIHPTYECGGFFIGNRLDLEQSFVFSVKDIYYEHLVGTMSSFNFDTTYTGNAQDYAEKWQEENCCDDYLVGTYHSHGRFDAFHSNVDDIYARTFNLMIICSPSTRRIEVWYWHLGLSRWFEGELIVYDDTVESPGNKPVYCEESVFTSSAERFPMRTYHKKKKVSGANKKVAVIGCGTLGNLVAQNIVDGNLCAEVTLVDLDHYERANLPRSPMVDIDAVGKPKAFALAEAMARNSHNLYQVHGIVADVRKLSLDFFEQFDVIVTPLDNLECRYYISYCAYVLQKPLVNLGTNYVGLNGVPSFSGDVYYKPSHSKTCLDCFYPLYKSNDELLRKRVSCGGALPEKVVPQVISSSMLIASIAFVCIKRALRGDNSTAGVGYNVSDVFSSEGFFDKAPVKESVSCSFSSLHASDSEIKTLTVSPRTQLRTLYQCIKRLFGDASDTEYEIDMPASCLTYVKYRINNPIHSIYLDSDSVGRIYQLIGNEYFPRDHVYAVSSPKKTEYIRIKISKGDKK